MQRKLYRVESIDVMTDERAIVGQEFKNKKYAVSLLKDLKSAGIHSKAFVLKERYIN